MRKVEKLEKLLAIFIVLTLMFIWGQSVMNRELSSEESGFVYNLLCPFFEIFMGKGNVSELFIRKLAHFTEFTVLGLELRLFFNMVLPVKGLILLINSWIAGTFCALIDETVQIFSERGPEIADVWLDSSGCMTGVLVMTMIIVLHNKRRRKKT